MEVHERHDTAALHHAVRSHRRVDAPGQQARHASRGPRRQATGSALLVEVVERLGGQHLDVDDELGVAEVDPPAARFLDASADLALNLRRGERKPLVGPPRGHAKAAACAIAEVAKDRGAQQLDVGRTRSRVREVGDAEHMADSFADLVAARERTEHDFDPSHQRANARHLQVRQGTTDVAHEPAQEPGTVLPLEGNLLIVDDNGVHRGICNRRICQCEALFTLSEARMRGSVPAHDGPLDRSGQAGVDPVAGEEQTGDAGPGLRTRWLVRRHGKCRALLADDDRPPHLGARSRRKRRAHLAQAQSHQFLVGLAHHRVGTARDERQMRGLLAEDAFACRTPTAWSGPGRPTNDSVVTARSSQRLTVTIGDAAVLRAFAATGASGGGTFSKTSGGVPRVLRRRRRTHRQPGRWSSPAVRAACNPSASPSWPAPHLMCATAFVLTSPPRSSMNRFARQGVQLVERLQRYRERGVAAAGAEHAGEDAGKGCRGGDVDRLVQRRDGKRFPQQLDEPRWSVGVARATAALFHPQALTCGALGRLPRRSDDAPHPQHGDAIAPSKCIPGMTPAGKVQR